MTQTDYLLAETDKDYWQWRREEWPRRWFEANGPCTLCGGSENLGAYRWNAETNSLERAHKAWFTYRASKRDNYLVGYKVLCFDCRFMGTRPDEMTCASCKENKEALEFSIVGFGRLSNYCLDCRARKGAAWKTKNMDKVRQIARDNYHRQRARRYGFNEEDIALMESTPMTCAICGEAEIEGRVRNIQLDHDHLTQRFRGWLCNNHNTGLGMFHDSEEELLAAVTYLKTTAASRAQ